MIKYFCDVCGEQIKYKISIYEHPQYRPPGTDIVKNDRATNRSGWASTVYVDKAFNEVGRVQFFEDCLERGNCEHSRETIHLCGKCDYDFGSLLAKQASERAVFLKEKSAPIIDTRQIIMKKRM